MFRKINDFDGDGKADFAVTRNDGGNKVWYVWQSTNGFRVFPWGVGSDQNYQGDFDGDGKTDFGVMRKTTPGTSAGYSVYSFWLTNSQTDSFRVEYFEVPTSIITSGFQQDFDGDGKTDLGVFFEDYSVYIEPSLSPSNPRSFPIPWGHLAVRTGDMTGDGKADIVSVNTFTQQVTILDYATNSTRNVQFGAPGDQFVPADFDGDSKGDLAIYRPSNGQWWWLRSSNNVVNAATFGTTGDVPVPADYDGDGKTDIAIWRAGAQSQYWVYGSQVGIFVFDWGVSSDTVVRY